MNDLIAISFLLFRLLRLFSILLLPCGTTEHRNYGTLELRNTGTSEHWNFGTLELLNHLNGLNRLNFQLSFDTIPGLWDNTTIFRRGMPRQQRTEL
jgi:hypothetical protein